MTAARRRRRGCADSADRRTPCGASPGHYRGRGRRHKVARPAPLALAIRTRFGNLAGRTTDPGASQGGPRMAEEKSSGGWLKAVVGTVTGLLGGAAGMYVPPLVDSVIKPSKPLANFAVESSGLQVTFQNRSAGTEGYWDFGDGSALEPVNMTAPTVTHAFA